MIFLDESYFKDNFFSDYKSGSCPSENLKNVKCVKEKRKTIYNAIT